MAGELWIDHFQVATEVTKLAPTLRPDQTIIVCLSGRGDKDVQQVSQMLGI